MSRTLVLLFAVVCSTGLFIGCGSDDDDGGSSNEPVVVSKQIAAATGGVVRDPQGRAELAIPPGALAADTEITLAITGKANGSAASVYDFGPDGLTFATPAVLTIALEGAVPAGKRAALAIGEGSSWVEIEGSMVADGKVQGPVAHFSRFTVIYVDDGAVAGACEEAFDAFEACGGDPVGAWALREICAQNVPVEDPFEGACPQAQLSAEVQQQGTLTFADGTLEVRGMQRFITETAVFPSSCLRPDQTCTSINGNDEGFTCSGDDVCTCSRTKVETSEDSVASWSLQGNSLEVDGMTVPFCVEGDSLELIIPERGYDVLYQLERTPQMPSGPA